MIKLFVMDVDGTLTDGGIYYDNNGNEFIKFNVKDGAGIKRLQSIGIKTMILTGRRSKSVEIRAKNLSIDYVIQGAEDKAAFLKGFLEHNIIAPEEVAYIGDDINDLEPIRNVVYSACPNDAVSEVKTAVHAVCSLNGGQGAVREFSDYIINEFLYLCPVTDEKGAWYTSHQLRAHAGGGIEGYTYTNSKEALFNTYTNGIKIVELDVTITSDEMAVISHNFMFELTPELPENPSYEEFMNCKICGKFTPLSLEDVVDFIVQHSECYIVIDHPAKGLNQLMKIINCLLDIIYKKNLDTSILNQFIVQVFTVKEHKWVQSLGLFKNLEFYFSAKRDIEGTIEYIVKNNVHTVSINKSRLNKNLVAKFNRLGIKVFSPSINDEESIQRVFDMGVWGITSDFADNETLNKIVSRRI